MEVKPEAKTEIIKTEVIESKPELTESKKKIEKTIPSITSELPNAFRKGRKLYPKEIAYLKEIFQDSLDYDKIRITRDHWFSYGSTRVTGNTINFTSSRGGEYLFEDTPHQQLNQAGLDLMGHEAMHVWQFQNGGWAYIGETLAKQLAGYYSTGSRNTAYDWRMAVKWEVPWEKWSPEQQAQIIDQWNLATRNRRSPEEWLDANPSSPNGQFVIDTAKPYLEKVRRREGAPQYSIPGIIVASLVLGGAGYLLGKQNGAHLGIALSVILNLPWKRWANSKKKV